MSKHDVDGDMAGQKSPGECVGGKGSRVEKFIDFITHSPSAWHAADYGARILQQAGFRRLDEARAYPTEPGGYLIIREGTLVAWIIPNDASRASAIRLVGAHTDSPGVKLKTLPELSSCGFNQAAVEIYGGPLLASFFDRELELAGQVVDSTGRVHLVRTGPVMRIPHLCVHLDREVNSSFSPSKQKDLQPVVSLTGSRTIADVVADAAGLTSFDEIDGHDLIAVDTQPPRVFGADGDFLASPRLDNLSSVEPAVRALVEVWDGGQALERGSDIVMLSCFNHEEVGSASRSGAQGPVLSQTITRIVDGLGGSMADVAAMIARSVCVSSDAAHSVHPNFADHHDAVNRPVAGAGPVVKVNSQQRYATDAVTHAAFRRACRAAGVNAQVFVSNNDRPCGTTIGPFTAARLGMPTVDIGMAILSMHSAREMCAVSDIDQLTRALYAVWTAPELFADNEH